MRDLLNCVQRDDESLSEFRERFIETKAQVPNALEEIVIAAVVEGLAIGLVHLTSLGIIPPL